MPSFAEMNSATRAPPKADETPSFMPAIKIVAELGTRRPQKVCHLVDRMERNKIGRASWRGRGENSGGAGSFKKKKKKCIEVKGIATPQGSRTHHRDWKKAN